MMNVEYLTECYIKVYEKALELTDDQNIATTAATMIVTTVANQLRLQSENTTNSLVNLFNTIALNNKKQAMKSSRMSEDNKKAVSKCQVKQDQV